MSSPLPPGHRPKVGPPDDPREARLHEAIARFLEATAAGEPDSGPLCERCPPALREELLRNYPDVENELREFLDAHDKVHAFAAQLKPNAAVAPDSQSPAPRPPDSPKIPGVSDDAKPRATEQTVPSDDIWEFDDDGPPQPGSRIQYIGDYELIEQIARGGMGVVYKARQVSLNRIVAVKMILAGQFASTEDVRRFRLEAEAAANLDHPGIVPIYEIGEHEGHQYFSMGYVRGPSLAGELADGPLPPRKAAELVKSVAEAVEYAHDKGVIHRDLKPGNILIDRDGKPKVTDFGLAKRSQLKDGLTVTGQILGTPSYMPPEQATGLGEQVRETADVYALGAVLYAALTGRPPFQADNPLDTMRQVIDQEPIPPRQLNPNVPKDLDTICLKCLEKSRRRRYQFARNLAADLGRFLRGEAVDARPIGATVRLWRWCKRKPAVASLLVLLFLSLAVGMFVSTHFAVEASRRATDAEIAQGKAERNALAASKARDEERRARLKAERMATRVSLNRGLDLCDRGVIDEGLLWLARALKTVPQEAADLERLIRSNLGTWRARVHPIQAISRLEGQFLGISPDGEIALTSAVNAEQETIVSVWQTSTGEPFGEPLNAGGPLRAFAVSRDHSGVALLSEEGTVRVWRLPNDDPAGRLLPHERPVELVSIGGDGRVLVTADEQGTCRVWNVQTGLPVTEPWTNAKAAVRLAMTADGRFVATLEQSGTLRIHDLTTGHSAGPAQSLGQTVRVPANKYDVLFFSDDGSRIVAHLGATTHVLPVENGRLGPEARRFGNSALFRGPVGMAIISSDGKTLVTGHSDRKARVWDVESGEMRGDPLPIPVIVSKLSLSDDGRLLLTGGNQAAFTSLLGYARLWSMTSGEPLSGPLVHSGLDAASLTADGSRMMTVSAGTLRTWSLSVRRRQSKAIVRMPHPGGWVFSVAFSPDERMLITGCTDGAARLWDADTGEMIGAPVKHPGGRPQLIHRAAFDLSGSRFFTASHDGVVHFWSTATREPLGKPLLHRMKTRGLLMVWSAVIHPQGRLMATGTGTGAVLGEGDTSVRFWDIETGRQVGEPIRLGGGVRGIAFTPDGTRFVTACMDGTAQLWETATRDPIGPPMRHPLDVRSIAVSPDGRTILTGCEDGAARFWDIEARQLTGIALKHDEAIGAVAYSPDGRIVATGGHDRVVRLWDAVTGRPIGEPLQHRGAVLSVAFNADGTRLATAAADRMARIWSLRPAVEESPAEIMLWAEVTTGLTLDEQQLARRLTAEEWRQRKQRWEPDS